MANEFLQPDEFEMADVEMLQSRLYRWDCPALDALGDYYLKLVEARQRDVIEAHLGYCLLCRQELEALAVFLEVEPFTANQGLEPEMKASPVQQLWTMLQAGVAAMGQGRWQTAGVRGEASASVRLTFEVGGLPEPVELFVDVGEELDGYRLNAQLALSERLEALFGNALVEIWQAESLAAIVFVDEDGAFHCHLGEKSPLLIRITTQNRVVLSGRIEF
jgi:hypothetical protein